MKRIAFIKFAGLAAGGCEKYLQNIACILSKSDEFEVDYFYTNAAPYINWNSPFVHPDNDESRKKIMEEHNFGNYLMKKIMIMFLVRGRAIPNTHLI